MTQSGDHESGFECRNCPSRHCLPYCMNLPDRLYQKNGRFNYVKCKNCGLVQLEQIPSNLNEYYSGYRHHVSEPLYYRVIREIVLGHCYYLPKMQPGAILDIGCGNGWYLKKMAKKGWRIVGCEFEQSYARLLSQRIGAPVVCREELYSGYDNHFDVITFHFSFEHVSEPLEYLRLAWKCLKHGGTVYLSVPNVESRETRLFKDKWFALDAPRHITFYTKALLSESLQKVGFRNIKIKNLAVPTVFAGSVSYTIAGIFHPWIWYLSILPGMLFCLVVRDGNFSIRATKP